MYVCNVLYYLTPRIWFTHTLQPTFRGPWQMPGPRIDHTKLWEATRSSILPCEKKAGSMSNEVENMLETNWNPRLKNSWGRNTSGSGGNAVSIQRKNSMLRSCYWVIALNVGSSAALVSDTNVSEIDDRWLKPKEKSEAERKDLSGPVCPPSFWDTHQHTHSLQSASTWWNDIAKLFNNSRKNMSVGLELADKDTWTSNIRWTKRHINMMPGHHSVLNILTWA